MSAGYQSVKGVLVRRYGFVTEEKAKWRPTSSVTGPDDGVASPMPFGGFPMLHLLNSNSVARSGARGVGWLRR
jgi:hypothetical protein